MSDKTNTYFISDLHLGVDLKYSSRERENLVVAWLLSVEHKAKAIYLVGDIFDHWFEYKRVVPKGYVRLLGTLAKLSDQGVDITFIRGNHDMWVHRYFEEEIGIKMQSASSIYDIDDKKWYINHGDGLDPSDKSYLFIKKILRNPYSQRLYGLVPPRLGLTLMKHTSGESRKVEDEEVVERHRKMIIAAKNIYESEKIDYFICGHLHAPTIQALEGFTYCNLGDWMNHFSYGEWDGHQLNIKSFSPEK